jgi:putative FmdB family regulatory protein
VPFYEYRRPDGTTFEVLQKMVEPALTHDPDTGVPVQRVLHAPAIHFKGKGFYNTDYGTKKRNREKSANDSSSSSSSSSDSSSSSSDGSSSSSSDSKKTESTSSSSSSDSSSGSSGSSSSSSSSD